MEQTTRRALIGAIAIGGTVAAISAAAPAIPFNDAGEQAFADWKVAHARIEAWQGELEDTPQHYWDAVDAAEIAVLNDTATTKRAAERKLWIALQHSVTASADDDATLREDVAHFAGMTEWSTRFVVASIAVLRAGRA